MFHPNHSSPNTGIPRRGAGVTITTQPESQRPQPFRGTLQPTFQAHVSIDYTGVDQSGFVISGVHIEDRPSFSAEVNRRFSETGKDIGHGNDWQHMRIRIQREVTQQGTIGAAATFLGRALGGAVVDPTIAEVEAATLIYARIEHDRDMLEILSTENSSMNRSRGSQGRGYRSEWESAVRQGDTELAESYLSSMYALGSSQYNPNYNRDFQGAYDSIPAPYQTQPPRATSPERLKKERKKLKTHREQAEEKKRAQEREEAERRMKAKEKETEDEAPTKKRKFDGDKKKKEK